MTGQDLPAAGALIDAAFGPGRFVKTAERLREHNRPLVALSVVADASGGPAGCVLLWPIRIGERPALLLGPFAVARPWRGQGLGAALIERACRTAAAQSDRRIILLVGDKSYFERFRFEGTPPGRVRMPGPVDPRRVLWRGLDPRALEGAEGLATPG